MQFGRAPQERDAIVRVVKPRMAIASHLASSDCRCAQVLWLCDDRREEESAQREAFCVEYFFINFRYKYHLKIIPVNLARTGRIPCFLFVLSASFHNLS